MFCSKCGNRLADGAKFCSECGSRVQDAAEQEFRFGNDVVFEEPKIETQAVIDEESPAPKRESVSFDWSAVVDEPHRREIPNIKSPWGTTGSIDEKELYAEMTPSTDRSRTMSFIDVLKAEKEEKEKKAEERAFVYTEVLEIDPDMSSFNDAPSMTYAPLYEDVDEPVKTPFDDIERPAERRTFDNTKEPTIETSRETIAQFDEYVKSFEAGAGIIHDEPRFERPEPPRPVSEEPKFELPDFLKRAAAPAKEEPAFEEPVFEAPVFEAPEKEPETIDFEKDVIAEPTFEIPDIKETAEEPAFEEPKYEEPAFEEPKYDEGDFEEEWGDDAEDRYIVLHEDFNRDADREEREEKDNEAFDEEALFAEMEAAKPGIEKSKTGMTIAAPADAEEEIAALRKRLMELTGTDIKLTDGNEDLTMEPETTSGVDKVFDRLTPASEPKAEPADEEAISYDSPEDLYLNVFESEEPELLVLEDVPEEEPTMIVIEEYRPIPEPAPAPAPAVEEPAPLVLEDIEPVPAPAVEEPAPLVLEDIEPAPAPAVEEPAPLVLEDIEPAPASAVEEPAPVVVEEIKPAPVVLESIEEEKVEEIIELPKTEEPVSFGLPKTEEPAAAADDKSSDALSLEELEKDLFGETPTAEAEAEETKKIDKFYTLYRKNEEFQRLLDEEYDKLKGEAAEEAPKAKEADKPAEIPAEESKAYRQVEDETIYKAFEIPPELMKAPPKEADAGVVKAPAAAPVAAPAPAAAPAATPAPVPAKADAVPSKKDDKKAAKAEKAKEKQAKKAAKARAKAEAKATGVEYEEVDTGSGFLTALAVIIAIILVILLAIILILQVAPDSGIAIAIDSLIESLTGGFGAIDPGNGPFLL